jgi:Tfp pilus assembly protein PilN
VSFDESTPIPPGEESSPPGGNRRARRALVGTGPVAELSPPDPTDGAGGPLADSEDRRRPKPARLPRSRPSKSTRNAEQLPIGGVPKVDLLPPELKEAREWRRARGRALILVLLGALVMLTAVAAATWWAQLNTAARDAAQARTDELLAMQSEFVEVNQVQGAIRSAEDALAQASTTDILWRDLLVDLQRTLPAGTRITTLTIESSSPTAALALPTDPLRAERVASVTFTAVSASVPDVVSWTRAVLDVPGVVYAAPRSTIADESLSTFTVEMSVDVDGERLRNQPEAAEDAETETQEDAG